MASTAGNLPADVTVMHHDRNHSADQLHLEPVHVDPPPPVSILAFYLIMMCLIGSQTAIFYWRKRHPRSYDLATLVGLWLVPAYLALNLKCWRFLATWAFYSGVTGYWLWRCSNKMSSSTPRKVYAWFFGVYRISVALGLAGYGLCVVQVFDPMLMLSNVLPPGLPITLLWYGLYFGVLGRDSAEVASDRMAAVMGTGRSLAISVKKCGMCAGDLQDFGVPPEQVPQGEQTATLPCKHSFHRQCLQGWTIVGKKDTCPQCMEKVDLRALYADKPWQTKNLNWIQMLDGVRYMVVWLPAILTAAHLVLHVLGLDPPHEQVVKVATAGSAAANATLAANATNAAAAAAAGGLAGVAAAGAGG